MRWSISTSTNIDSNTNIKTTTTNKQFIITIGDIVGLGKSVYGAVKNLAVKIPSFIQQLKQNGNAGGAATASMVNNIVQPLAVVIQGMEVYKKVMGVIETVTPIVQTVARATGVWCSPGNIGDIAQIILGTVQQILIALVTEAILRLKEWVWNFEIVLWNISESVSVQLTKNLKALDKKIEDNVNASFNVQTLNLNPFDTSSGSGSGSGSGAGINSGVGSAGYASAEALKSIYDQLNNQTAVTETDNGAAEVAKLVAGEKQDWSTSYETQLQTNVKFVRLLRGSLMDCGIEYSDDGGSTWNKTEQITGSWCKFGKILVDGKYRYIACSIPYIKKNNLKQSKDKEWQKNEKEQYDRDYFFYSNNAVGRYPKNKKDGIEITNAIFNSPIGCYDASGFIEGLGVWYSDDDGISWQASVINEGYYGGVYEFQEKVDNPASVVVCSYDYKGIKYSYDGINFENSVLEDENTEIADGRWISITVGENANVVVRTKDISTSVEAISTIRTNEKIETVPISSNVEIKMSGFETTCDRLNDLLGRILVYIHENYTDRLPNYSDEFWQELIQDILNEKYTFEDAVAGVRL